MGTLHCQPQSTNPQAHPPLWLLQSSQVINNRAGPHRKAALTKKWRCNKFKVELTEKNDYPVIDSEGTSARGINNLLQNNDRPSRANQCRQQPTSTRSCVLAEISSHPHAIKKSPQLVRNPHPLQILKQNHRIHTTLTQLTMHAATSACATH